MEVFRLEPAQHAPYVPAAVKEKDRTKYLNKIMDEAVAQFDELSATNKAGLDGTLVLRDDRSVDLRQGGQQGSSERSCYPIHDLRLCHCCAPKG